MSFEDKFKQAYTEKYFAWCELNNATASYVASVHNGTENAETYSNYIKANERFTAAFNRIEKLKKKNKQRMNNDNV